MTDLTEQWRKGELPEGWYYIRRGLSKRIDIAFLGRAFFEGNIEVVKIVPTFEEWAMTKNLSERAHIEMYKARGKKVKLENENTRLKKLLKRIKDYLPEYTTPMTLLVEIDELLGEE